MYITHLVPLNLPTIICGYRKEKEHGKCKGGEEERGTFGPDSTRSGAGILNGTAGVSWIPLMVLQDPSEGFFSS